MLIDYLQKYAASTRQKVDMELAERFDFKMRREGEKPIRLQIAKARRAATMMKNLLEDFKDMPPKQLLELENSTKTLRKLANDLEGLALFAKGYQKFYLSEINREEEQRLDAFALQRWGKDNAAATFEWSLILELSTEEGSIELGRWMHGKRLNTSVHEGNFISPFKTRDMPGENKRREAAKALFYAHDQYTEQSHNGKYCHVGILDYEKFLADRKLAAIFLKNIVQVSKSSDD